MLGRFLELSLPAADVAESLEFYESLGFAQAAVGEAWKHPYAVVTDGRVYLGLHGAGLESPTLTFVTPDLRVRLDELSDAGIEVERARLDDLALNEAEFRDPTGLWVRLVEARTFSPPALEPGFESALGYFEEYVVGADDLRGAGEFWERLGFVAFREEDDDDAAAPKLVASHRDINLAFLQLDLGAPMLCFTAVDMSQRIARLRERGFAFARRVPREFHARGAAALLAPDGQQVLLLEPEA
jgi:catechol 2,3-dioxygenase-like lactoylglutathione lyase family enzyme